MSDGWAFTIHCGTCALELVGASRPGGFLECPLCWLQVRDTGPIRSEGSVGRRIEVVGSDSERRGESQHREVTNVHQIL